MGDHHSHFLDKKASTLLAPRWIAFNEDGPAARLFWKEGFLLKNHPDTLFSIQNAPYYGRKQEWLDEKGNTK